MSFIYNRGSAFKAPALIILFCLILTGILPANRPAAAAERESEISALAAVLMDRESGRVLWERNPHQQLPVASTTKIMTALLALELGCEKDIVVASKRAAGTEGSSIWLEAGEEKTLCELIYGLILLSGNDAAVAIAEHLAGSVGAFAQLMNEKARQIGAINTNFTNPHGLPDDNHYSTAYDMALITRAALANERFREICATREYTISWPGHPWDRIMSNQNRLLEQYPGGDGVKTGWTKLAGRCFVGSATRESWQLIVVVLNAPQMWEDTEELLDYGFSAYQKERLFVQGQYLRSAAVDKGKRDVNLVAASDFYYPLAPGETDRLRYQFNTEEKIIAPLAAGQILGSIEIYLDDLYIGSMAIRAGHAVDRLPVGEYLKQFWNTYWE